MAAGGGEDGGGGEGLGLQGFSQEEHIVHWIWSFEVDRRGSAMDEEEEARNNRVMMNEIEILRRRDAIFGDFGNENEAENEEEDWNERSKKKREKESTREKERES